MGLSKFIVPSCSTCDPSNSVRIAEPGPLKKTGTGRKWFQLASVFGGVSRMGRMISCCSKSVLLNNFGFVALVEIHSSCR